MKDIATFIALNRFGLGAAPGEAEKLRGDPRGWLAAQIVPRQTIPAALGAIQPSELTMRQIHQARLEGMEQRREMARKLYKQVFQQEVVDRARHAIATDTPFAERMVMFWSNHFTVSRTRALIGPALPAYEREAIRPHIFGRFEDMMKAVYTHVCMVTYLDNAISIGPNSFIGERRQRRNGSATKINENLAREILELHTLGVNGGYTQADIIEFAKVLTGWSHGGLRPKRRPPTGGRGIGAAFRQRQNLPVNGAFEFNPFFHEPGAKTILGKTYREDGMNEGLAVIHDLARHPSTAKFIATKLVRHFVADDPPADAVEKVAAVFRATGGDLAEVSRAVVGLDPVWREPLAKVKSHYELVISALRAAEAASAQQRDVILPLRELGQLPFNAPSPQGWGDRAQDWIAPEALMRRIEWLRRMAARLPAAINPETLLDDAIGPVARDTTRLWMQRAPSSDAAIALVFASPEFQRR
ncbi:MAG: DUF1800 family protein [Beijerinckiaceae bacterium]